MGHRDRNARPMRPSFLKGGQGRRKAKRGDFEGAARRLETVIQAGVVRAPTGPATARSGNTSGRSGGGAILEALMRVSWSEKSDNCKSESSRVAPPPTVCTPRRTVVGSRVDLWQHRGSVRVGLRPGGSFAIVVSSDPVLPASAGWIAAVPG